VCWEQFVPAFLASVYFRVPSVIAFREHASILAAEHDEPVGNCKEPEQSMLRVKADTEGPYTGIESGRVQTPVFDALDEVAIINVQSPNERTAVCAGLSPHLLHRIRSCFIVQPVVDACLDTEFSALTFVAPEARGESP
jgi:hypothetical protein